MKKLLEIALNLDPMRLVPSSTFKSEIVILNHNEFEKLANHLNITLSDVIKNEWDTIKIKNTIFKKQSIKLERNMKLNIINGQLLKK
jgi:hypothetical protein